MAFSSKEINEQIQTLQDEMNTLVLQTDKSDANSQIHIVQLAGAIDALTDSSKIALHEEDYQRALTDFERVTGQPYTDDVLVEISVDDPTFESVLEIQKLKQYKSKTVMLNKFK